MIIRIVLLSCVLIFNDAAYEGERCSVSDVAGVCTLITNCQTAREELAKRIPPTLCGFEGATPVVCCVNVTAVTHTTPETLVLVPVTTQRPRSTTEYIPDIPLYEDTFRPGECQPIVESLTSTKTGQKSFDKCIDYQEKYVFPCESQKNIYSRRNYCHRGADELLIVGNGLVIEGEFPHEVKLGFEENDQPISWLCGGSIISENFVLTAGHCTSTRVKTEVKYVLVGSLTSEGAKNLSNIYKIKKIIKHPDYQPPSKYNDIALLETEKIALNQFVVPACLHFGDPVTDERVIATGWGQRGSLDEVMQKVNLYKFNTEECGIEYPVHRNMRRGFDPNTQICYGDKFASIDTCQGYSGGPILIKNKKIYCMYTIVGVSSVGKGCKTPVLPSIYTKVSHYVPWIESIVWP